MRAIIASLDRYLIPCCRINSTPFARIALFIIFFWFGLLKVLGESPADTLVTELLARTLPTLDGSTFLKIFGVFEMVLGTAFLFRGIERLVIPALLFHLTLASLPLVLLPALTWSAPFTPTLAGQYIIKNIALAALAVAIASGLEPLCPPAQTTKQ